MRYSHRTTPKDLSHLTAIGRNKLSSPMRWLQKSGLLIPDGLDYGCGRGKCADSIGFKKYDPHYFPFFVLPKSGKFRTITCNFVLNVIPEKEDRMAVVEKVFNLLQDDGTAFFTVRRDRRKLNGFTSKGTWQGYIELPFRSLRKDGSYEIYILEK
jgi:hypothetical protein